MSACCERRRYSRKQVRSVRTAIHSDFLLLLAARESQLVRASAGEKLVEKNAVPKPQRPSCHGRIVCEDAVHATSAAVSREERQLAANCKECGLAWCPRLQGQASCLASARQYGLRCWKANSATASSTRLLPGTRQ